MGIIGQAKVNDRRERACALLWARSMLNEPEAYLHLSPALMTYLQGLYKIRAEHLKNFSRWAVALASIVSANMADKGHRRRNSRPTTVVVCQSALRDQQRPRTCWGLYPPRRIGSQMILSSSRLHHSCNLISLPQPLRLGRPARGLRPPVCRSLTSTPTLLPTRLCNVNRLLTLQQLRALS